MFLLKKKGLVYVFFNRTVKALRFSALYLLKKKKYILDISIGFAFLFKKKKSK